MFDSLLKPRFYSKCKAYLKLIKTRLLTIRNKRSAVQKFLKKDIVDLLKDGLDYNAYGRAEGLLVEQNMSACYDLIANFVECISTHVRDLSKRKDCPDECKEAIASLIYAAARFSDLPELRDLRTLFTHKFGNNLEPYSSKEFVEKLRQHHPSKEMKIQLLHNLALEFTIKWDSKALEQRLYSPALSHEEETPKHDPQNEAKLQKNGDEIKVTSKGNERDSLSHEKRNDIGDEWRRVQGSSDTKTTTTNNSSHNGPKASSSSSDDEEVESKRRFSYGPPPPPYIIRKFNNDENHLKTTTTTTTKNSSQNGPKASSSSFEIVSKDDEAESKRRFSYGPPPPPYIIQKFNKDENNLKATTSEAPMKSDSHHHEPFVPKKPIPKSVRRRPLKPPLHENTGTAKTSNAAKLDISGVNGMKSEKASDSSDEEERIMDGLLMHYSKKQTSYQLGTGKTHTKVEYSGFTSLKGTSLPRNGASSMETLKGHDRATSLVPEMLRTAGHVHPSLPDYDDFTARLAALRGN